jgi:hypothetical protein
MRYYSVGYSRDGRIFNPETLVAIAQLNSSISNNSTTALFSKDPEDKNLVLTSIESNDTDFHSVPTISVSHEDFWRTFGPLLKTSVNGSANTLE